MLLIASIDYTFGGAFLIHRTEWTVVQFGFWVAIAYLLGQIAAGPSSALLEHLVARKLLHSPLSIALGLSQPRWREKTAQRLFANREYSPLPAQTRARILEGAATVLKVTVSEITDPEAVFGIAFGAARGNADTVARLDQFRNLYGFSRNVAFVSIIACILILIRYSRLPTELDKGLLLTGTLVLAIGMFGRFLKFYAAYSREVLGAYSGKLNSGSGKGE